MKKLKNILSGFAVAAVVLTGSSAAVYAAPAQKSVTPPSTRLVSGKQAKPAVEPGSRDAKNTAPLGATNAVAVTENGARAATNAVTPNVGYVSSVDFSTPYNYCWKNLVYPTIKNTTATTQYAQVRLYNQTGYRDIYTTLSANSYAYPAFYGVDGTWSAYLYVWNGSSYQYDEYLGGTNTCNVSVTRTYNTGGWVQLAIQNTGTAYATQTSTELAPYPLNSTYPPYTGTQYDYPAAGGATLYRWFYVGTSPYGIASSTYGSFNSPTYFTGDL